jgi:DNA repair protein RecO (recombination protein O)
MLHKTAGLVLHTVPYGETSVVVRIFTERFGIQSYLVNGVRSSKAKTGRANLLRPVNLLDLVVYHRDEKNLQRLSDFRFAYLYRALYADPVKNAVALFMVELLDKTLKEPDPLPELFDFTAEALRWADSYEDGLGNLPLFFTLKVAAMLGFHFYGRYRSTTSYLDLKEGRFVAERPPHPHFLSQEGARLTDTLLQATAFDSLSGVATHKHFRRTLLSAYQDYFQLHVAGFSRLQSPRILMELWD